MVRDRIYPTISTEGLPPELIVAMDAFLDALAVQNFSRFTIRERRCYLRLLIEWLDERGVTSPSEVTLPLLQSYQRYLFHFRQRCGKPLGVLAQRSRLLPIAAWFKWLAREKRIDSDPTREMVLPKAPKRLPRAILTREEIERVLSEPCVEGAFGLRDRAMMELLYSTAMRRSELVQLRLEQLDLERRTVQVIEGKGQKDRVVPIGQRALQWLHAYLKKARPLLVVDPHERTLFLSSSGLPLHPNTLSDRVRRYIKAAGILKGGSCHLFRHTAATLMMDNGAHVRAIQAMLGHASLETTQIYTHVSIGQLRDVHDQTHPASCPRMKPVDGDDDDTDDNIMSAIA